MAQSTKLILLLVGVGISIQNSVAQAADTKIKLDLLLTPFSKDSGLNQIKFYDRLGRFSTVSLSGRAENGWKFFVSQRLQKIDGDPDNGPLDEYFLEDAGLWRAGKQYLPFGRQLMRESVLALRGDTNLFVEGLPVSIAIVDAGKSRQSGLVGRIGPSSYGFSFAVGQHFAINGSALTLIRDPEAFLPVGSGYRQVFGVDAKKRSGRWTFEGEAIYLRSPHLAAEQAFAVADLAATYGIRRNASVSMGLTQRSNPATTTLRVSAQLPMIDKVSLEPLIRFRGNRFYDLSIVIHVKL